MYTRTWRSLITIASKLGKGVGGLTDISPDICDFVSNDMFIEYPWKDTITTIAPTYLPITDGVQDLSSPINIYRLTSAQIVRTDTTPFQSIDLDVVDDNAVDLVPRSYVDIRSVSQQAGEGTLRLEGTCQVGVGVTLELRGTYQLNPVKIVDLGQELWFKDQYAQVALEGLMYWVYKLSDDARSGTAATDGQGRTTYTGQLAVYKAALQRMKNAEDWGASQGLFPAETMGRGVDYGGAYIYGF